MTRNTTYFTDDWKEKLVDDFYTQYYPNPRLEQTIFKYLDGLYYVTEDEVFDTIYRKSDDYFMGKSQITDDLQNLFGLTLPKLLKIGPGEEDYIEPARNPIPRRVLNNWLKSKKDTQKPLSNLDEGDPKVGTGKKPKGSSRRLYTDEDPSDTVSVKFRTKEDIVDTLNKASFKSKSHKRQSQIINLIHQRVRAAHKNAKDPETKKRLKRALDYITNKKEKSKEKTKRLQKQKTNEISRTLGKARKHGIGTKFSRPAIKANPDRFRKYTRDKYIKEHTSKINPQLMIGDEVTVVDVDKSFGTLHTPELYKDYVVIGRRHRQPENWEGPDVDTSYYVIEPIGMTGEERVDRTINSFPNLNARTERLYPTDKWMLRKGFLRGEHLTEQKSLKNNLLNVELEEGDKILVVSRKETPAGYREPFQDHEVELFTPYVVIEKKYSGHKAKHPYHYFLLPEEQYEIFINDPYDDSVDKSVKSLFPWIHDWILDNEDIITEDKESKISPELEVGDIVRVINIDGEHDRQPDLFKLYRVAYKGNKPMGHGYSWETEARVWYDIVPIDLDYDTVRTFDSRGTPMYDSKSLYRGDTWIKIDEVISEQSADSPGDHISDDDEEYVDNTPFTKKQILILNQLHKNLTRDELRSLAEETPSSYGVGKKFWEVMKLFGIAYTNDVVEDTRNSIYAKWAYDNWTEDGDYGSIEKPIKVPLKWYEIDKTESGSQIEYRDGTAEVLGFDEEDASERANYDFYSWGGDMEVTDYGDYEAYDSAIERADFKRLDEAKRIVKVLNEQDESGLKRQIIQAETEDFQELMYEVLRRVRQIPLDKTVSPRRIKEILSDDGVSFDLYQGADLNEEIHREYNRVRFYEYSQQLLKAAHSKGVRGHYFEGLLAGLFNGEVVSPMEGEMTDPKEDVLINGINYSAKLVRAQDKKWGTSSLLGGFKKAVIQRLVDRDIEVPDELLKRKLEVKSLNELIDLFPEGDPDRDSFQVRHMELFLKDSSVDRKYKEITMNYAFTSKSEEEIGTELHWIFGLIWGTNETFEGEELPTTNLKYYLMDTPSLIDGILDGDIHFTKGRNIREIRISEKSMVDSNGASEHSIIFPVVTRQDLKNLLYDEKSEEMVYKVMGIFKDFRPGTEKYMHHKIADVIADNPQEFIKKLQDLFPEKKITKETVSRIMENIDPEIKYAIDQQYRTQPDLKDDIIQSIIGDNEEDDTFYLNPGGEELNVPPIKIAQKFSDVNDYGNIKFDMQGGNGIAYFTDKDLVIKLTTDESEYFTANKLVGTDNPYIVKVIESAKIKTSHSVGDLFVIVQESLPMTKEMEQTWDDCCCGVKSPIHIDYLKEPALVLPPVSDQEKCIPIYDDIISIRKNFDEYGIVWSDIGIDNLGIKNGHLAVIDLGDTLGGTPEGKQVTLNLENIKIRPLTEKHIRKQLLLV